MTENLERARWLASVERFSEALPFLQRHLAEDPNDWAAHCLLSSCLVALDRFDPAEASALKAIQLAPDEALPHWCMARVKLHRGQLKEAEAAANESIRLDPDDVDYYSLAASIQFQRQNWKQCLKLANSGLVCDAEDTNCLNLRAQALVQLGQRAEAAATMESALARDPENAHTHANRGWGLLHEGKPREAITHFREALRLDPESEWARRGIVEALKAQNFVYRLMLGWFLWMSRLPRQVQWGIILGGVFGMDMLDSLGRGQPALVPLILPIKIAYIIFACLTWLAVPLFNLLLWLNPLGRHALSRDEWHGAAWFGTFMGTGLLLVITGLVMGLDAPVLVGFALGLATFPLSVIRRCEPGWPRWLMGSITATVVGCGLVVGARSLGLLPQGWTQQAMTLFRFAMLATVVLGNTLPAYRRRV